MSSVNNRLLRASVDSSGKLQYRAVMHGQGMLSGIGRRVSSLFGILSAPANDTVSLGNLTSLANIDYKQCPLFLIYFESCTNEIDI